jgi:hypothetical protein
MTHSLVRLELRRAQRTLRRELARLPSERELERIELRPEQSSDPSAGSRPQTLLVDEAGRRYMFKLASAEHIAAELFAYRLRALAGRVHVPTARRTMTLPELGEVTGMLQPQIPVVGSLKPEPSGWSKLQREAMLREHPWEWLLANLDTHIDQYVLVGEHELPIDIDWDHALVDLDQTELTRFNRRSATIAPIRNLLYSEYVLGRVRLDFLGMQLEARKIARIPDARVVELLDRHAEELELPADPREDIRGRVLRRKASLVDDFDRLIASLRIERDEEFDRSSASRSWVRRALVHARVLRPALLGYRSLLAALARVGRKPSA